MNRKTALRLLGIGRPAPKTTAGRVYRWGERSLVILALLYALVILFPQPIFAHSIQLHGITLHSRAPLPPEAAGLVDRIHERVAQSPLYGDDDTFRIFICDSTRWYAFFSPVNRDSFAISNSVSGNIFIARADLAANRAYRFGGGENERSFVGVAAHEIGHGLIRNHAGKIAAWRMPTWVKEGYSEYVAGESTLSDEEGIAKLLDGETDGSGAIRYFKWRKMVEYQLEIKGTDAGELLARSLDPALVEEDMLQWLRGTDKERKVSGPDATAR